MRVPVPNGSTVDLVVELDRDVTVEEVNAAIREAAEGAMEGILEYNEDPTYLRDLLVYKLTVEAKQRVEESGLSRRELARRLNTSVPQLYRLLDTTKARKSMNQLVSLLQVLDCSVDLVVADKEAVA